MAETGLPSTEAIAAAFTDRAAELDVAEVSSIWSPIVTGDEQLGRTTAQAIIDTIEETHPDLDATTREVLLEFGAAVGALSLRGLFQPFQSDAIWIDYQNGSGLTQEDAVRRVTNGANHAVAGVVLK